MYTRVHEVLFQQRTLLIQRPVELQQNPYVFLASNGELCSLDSLKKQFSLLEADLKGAKLREANFTKANFTKANFTKANLSRANLRETNLQ
jgi:uncharacterized protein YjbI with pentapeptide repeats